MAEKNPQDRRQALTESIRKEHLANQKRQRRRSTLIIAVIVVVALVVVAGIGYFIYRSTRPEGPATPPAGLSEEQPYYVLGAPDDSGKPVVTMHADFMCPACGAFEQVNGEDMMELVENDEVTLHLYVRRFLDTNSTTGDYSTRAGNAFAAVYADDPDNAMKYQQLLWQNQPEENTAGLDDDKLFDLAKEAGAGDDVKKDITSGTYKTFVRNVVDPAAQKQSEDETGKNQTPFVKVDDTIVDYNTWQNEGEFKKVVEKAIKEDKGKGKGSEASDGGGEASDGGK
jgi:protein-disulfide isomerase